ncbi:MAG: alanine racemase [Oscillospiraceae bacterium]|jgi:alanine racemase|nr:alanine racemase [Oscillospiraceae bacterium]
MLEHYHRTWAEISLDAIEANITAARACVPKTCKLMAVIKADGYGHGATALARFLDDKADYYAVAVLEEALTLRAAGITKPMLVLGYTSPSQARAVVCANLTQAVFSYEAAKTLSDAARKSVERVKIHAAIDTGMTRIGFADTEQSIDDIVRITQLEGVELEGIFTHMARADETDKTSADQQVRRFTDFVTKLDARGVKIPIRHICNSAGIMEIDAPFDMVRLGISLYGLYPSEEVQKSRMPLVPAMQWKTHVVCLKTVDAGVGVSYGHTFVTTRRTRIATLPIGYADGYPRALSNQGHVLIGGAFAPILGRVCMDQCMVDVTDIPDVMPEDEVVLIGGQNGLTITMEEIGAMSASFNYETTCRVGQRVPRVYTYKGEIVDFHSVMLTQGQFENRFVR